MKIRNAFTLVELLVVVAIIVILIAILSPSLERAMEAARKASCMANVHSIGNALEYYLQDFNRAYPDGETRANDQYGPASNSTPPNQLLVKHTVQAAKVFSCPGDPSPTNNDFWQFRPPYYLDFIEKPGTTRDPYNVAPWNSYTTPEILKGSSYMFSEDAAYGLKKATGTGVISAKILDPFRWAYMSEGFVIINGNSWRTVDPRDPLITNPNDYWSVRVDWNHLKTINMLLGDKSVANVEQYSPGGKVDPIANRFRSHPYQ